MMLLSFLAPFMLMLVGFVVSVAAGAARETDMAAPPAALTALLVAGIVLVLQALLWVRLGTLF
ncbi:MULTISPECIES: hypothetical protein [unclassified Paracoccus (in: a-proteobacteria)]|uniref:hypothetical protein n=1 Tax=unclassified Paracoccus (in: a-proteobacteria) TaxID=2688777 RepID=UPI001353D8DF|nr:MULTISPECIES: hypothetical protein [unclassified Paracoccus (in: a-proteobacteria)]UXU74338.1 hypothetical protein GB879_010555 [Paracoccus sp. SMMA_5]UXU80228.1 hypothetical protein GB880_010530 [Paracoccus sp. SMMA_5_TC]